VSYDLARAVRDAAVPLSSSERLLLLTLASYAKKGEVTMYPSQRTLVKKTAFDRRTVYSVLKGLVDDGILSVVTDPGPRRSTLYQINVTALARGDRRSPLKPPATGGRRSPQRRSQVGSEAIPSRLRGDPGSPDLVIDLVVDPVVDLKPAAPVRFRPDRLTAIAVEARDQTLKECRSDDPRLVIEAFMEICKQRDEPYDGAHAKAAIDTACGRSSRTRQG
jgi:hypothetical protein